MAEIAHQILDKKSIVKQVIIQNLWQLTIQRQVRN